MIRVEVKLVPFGIETMEKLLGVIEIVNDGTGNLQAGNYDVRLSDEPPFTRTGGKRTWRFARIKGWPRMKKGPYQLLLAALLAAIPPEER